jgi:hypothetical protein
VVIGVLGAGAAAVADLPERCGSDNEP